MGLLNRTAACPAGSLGLLPFQEADCGPRAGKNEASTCLWGLSTARLDIQTSTIAWCVQVADRHGIVCYKDTEDDRSSPK